ncbi:MAG: peroxiredoxin [Cytophagales bacterium]
MALKIGSKAPNFTTDSTLDKKFTLDVDKAGRPLILYFYPKDFTKGCTAEACEFRDAFSEFKGLDIDVVGVSKDNIISHKAFQKEHNLPFELLADEDQKIAKLYQAVVPILGLTKRITFLLDKTHTIVAIYEDMFGATKHISEMIKKIKEQAKH